METLQLSRGCHHYILTGIKLQIAVKGQVDTERKKYLISITVTDLTVV
jgi:hypothetical protein